ncbi:family 43 glycosylhydrolase [Actinoplanes sp. NPDC026619]|uniref:family 43 glycosylhydrolase n=1 Tax=Actinoplanes sp. NPDC026619 TaxID=3155798 RepID=UPI0033C1238A
MLVRSLLAAVLVLSPPPARHDDGLILRYLLDKRAGTVAADSSGHGRDGTVAGAPGWTGSQGLAFDGSSTYVQAPDNLLSGLTSITVATDVLIDAGSATPYFLYGFGNSSGGAGNGYLFATGNPYRQAITLTNWSGEQVTKPADGHNVARGTWKHLAYTQTGTTGVLYEDGVEVARNTAVSVLPTAIHGGGTTANAIGRSLYSTDALFKGKMRDFRVYDRALTTGEVAGLASRVNKEMLAADRRALVLTATPDSPVTGNIALPVAGVNGSRIAWQSSDSTVVSDGGAVTRPARGRPDAHVTLTATLTHGTENVRKTFKITVAAEYDDRQAARHAADELVVHGLPEVKENLDLPSRGAWDTVVTWSSGRPAVITPGGEVTRPAHGAGPARVTLTATVTRGGAKATRSFATTVSELPAPAAKKGYLFSYFTGEGTANGEQVYFSLSQGNDPLHWQQLNNSNPVLTSTLGTAGLRDPFIIRSPQGDKFYQIATDLKIYGNGNWDAAQRSGSKSIMVWESTDLVHWTDQRLVKVSPDTAGNTWAPEAFYDPTIGAYVVFWASKLYDPADTAHTGTSYNRMMYATTRDFWTFSEPKVWKDPGYSVIDSTMIEHNGTYYRFTKDERDQSSSSPCSKFIIAEKSTQIRALDYDFVAECIGQNAMSRGEGPLIFKDNDAEKWHLFIDEFGGRGYVPLESTDLDSGQWTPSTNYALPGRPRHGTVLPVTQAEYDRLLTTYQPDQALTAVDPVKIWTHTGSAPALPSTVVAHYADGSARSAAVTWDTIEPARYAQAGTFTVNGSLGARATVVVTSGDIPVSQVSAPESAVRIAVGVSRALTATVQPANADHATLTWKSSDPAVATADASGQLTTLKAGRAVVTASAGGRSAAIRVEVTTDIPADLLLHYDFDGNTADSSGRGFNAQLSGTPAWTVSGTNVSAANVGGPNVSASNVGGPNVSAANVGGPNVSAANVGGPNVSAPNVRGPNVSAPNVSRTNVSGTNERGLILSGGAYATIPNGVLAGQNSVTVAARVRWNASTTVNQWIFGLGPDSSRYLFASPSNGSKLLYSAITTGSWSAESKLTGATAFPGGSWQHLAVTLDGTTGTAAMYLNGVAIAKATGVTAKPADLYDKTKTYSGFIGKSLYTGDPAFDGAVDDFRIYGRVLTPAEILTMSGNTTGVAATTAAGLKAPAVITDSSSRIVLPLAEGTDPKTVAPTFTLAAGARISPPSGTVRDLRHPVTYTITGVDGAQRRWTIEAHIMRSPLPAGLNADPNIAVFDGVYWIYPTTDGFAGWSGTQFHAFSSTDLVNWTDHGVILDLGPDVTWAASRAWAPTIAEKDGKYYFYFCADTNIGVAVADSPAGPFHDVLGKPLIASGAFSGQMIDPAAFTDDDGTTYLYWGNGHAYVVPLNADMTSFDKAKVKEITPAGYNEGSFVSKRNGTYYFMWSQNDTRSADYQVSYATGPSPTGPFTPHGLILSKRPELGILGAGHHSVVQRPGTDDWFIAYHRFAIPGGDGTHRETTIDRLRFTADGLIVPVEPTLEGAQLPKL